MKHTLVCISSLFLAIGCAQAPDKSRDVAKPQPSNHDVDVASSSGTAGVPCTQEVALDCANGVDGCIGNRTAVHVCVAASAQPGPSCSQEVALECPSGEIDACLLSPPAAANHICVRQ